MIEEAIEDAKKNAAINNIHHASFYAGDVIKICDDAFFENNGRPDVIITDPPRAGMQPKALATMIRLRPRRIVYVSCNPASLARDGKEICAHGYTLLSVQPVDMFPQTAEIESVTKLRAL